VAASLIMKLVMVILLTAGVFHLPVFAGEPDTSASELQKKMDDVKKAYEALIHTENTGANTVSDLQKKQNDLQKAREALENAERQRNEEFEKARDLMKKRMKQLHSPEVYQAVVDGVRYSMLLHMPGGVPDSLVAKKEEEPAKPGSTKPAESPSPKIESRKRGFLFEPVK
jgi:predicted nuclease with TOPRIM domain